MRYLRITNKGELPKAALSLMGASTKRDDASKIGMFGTGAKYAIAALLREKVPVEIRTSETVEAGQWGGIDMAQTTLKSYRFKTVPVDMRGHLFDQIYLLEDSERKGTPLSFTTEMGGLGWTVEHALRELVSNALDEPEPAIKVVAGSDRSQHAGETAVYVGMTPAVADFWNSIDRWFLFRREPVASGDGWGVYSRWGPGVRVYRKGVLAYEDPSDSAYDYNLDALNVNEERKAGRWECDWEICGAMRYMPNEVRREILRVVEKNGGSFEAKFTNVSHSGLWREVVGDTVIVTPTIAGFLADELRKIEHIVLPVTWESYLTDSGGGCRGVLEIASSAKCRGFRIVPRESLRLDERNRLTSAIDFLARTGVDLDEEKIKVIWVDEGSFEGEYIPKDDLIYIHQKALRDNTKRVVHILFHEWMHKVSGAGDYNRAYARAIIDAWLGLAQEKAGVYL